MKKGKFVIEAGTDVFYAINRLCLRVLCDPGDQQYVSSDATLDAQFVKAWLKGPNFDEPAFGAMKASARDEIHMDEVPFAPR